VSAARAVVFAYHDVGVRCLRTLACAGLEIPLVITVRDDPAETQWFASVARTAGELGLEVTFPADANAPGTVAAVAAARPDFIFSFYYRSLLKAPLLALARRGALNMHGSLLPKYRGRAPVNWAILRGETQTGATLHYMLEQADAGDIVDQLAVPILADDDAREVSNKVTVAAEIILARSLPALLAGTQARVKQNLEAGQYCGRRRPEDGRIDWTRPARQIHNLVRAVAPPFPGAFTNVAGKRWRIDRTRVIAGPGTPGLRTAEAGAADAAGEPFRQAVAGAGPATLFGLRGRCYVACRDGALLEILAAATDAGCVDLPAAALELQRQPARLD